MLRGLRFSGSGFGFKVSTVPKFLEHLGFGYWLSCQNPKLEAQALIRASSDNWLLRR